MTTGPRLVPAHVLVLAALAIVAIIVGHEAAGAYEAARANGSFPPEIRRSVLFAGLFNAAVLAILVLGWLAELVAALAWFARRPLVRGRILARLALSLVPLVAFALGHLVANPRVLGLATQLRGALR